MAKWASVVALVLALGCGDGGRPVPKCADDLGCAPVVACPEACARLAELGCLAEVQVDLETCMSTCREEFLCPGQIAAATSCDEADVLAACPNL